MIMTPKPYLTRTIHLPGLGRKESPAPAKGQGRPIPNPSRKGSSNPAVMSITSRNASVDASSMAAAVAGSAPAGGGLSGWGPAACMARVNSPATAIGWEISNPLNSTGCGA